MGLAPCRAVDTRGNGFGGAFGPPGLATGVPRDFPLAGQCGIPAAAQAVSLNVTATNTLGPGFFRLAVIAGVSGADLIVDVNGYFVDLGLATPGACPPSMVRSGPICIDKYEASVWETTDPLLIAKIRVGAVTLAELQAAGAVQHGAASDDYGPGCPDTGNGCVNFYAVSIAGVTPSRVLTWFQAAAAARNAGRRLPTNAEWQVAALGTPDGAPCIVNAADPAVTGTAGCVSDVGAFDMVGNLVEWVAEWVPKSTSCPGALFVGTDDVNCLAGASTVDGPGALLRGGGFTYDTSAGVFIVGNTPPTDAGGTIGFRTVR